MNKCRFTIKKQAGRALTKLLYMILAAVMALGGMGAAQAQGGTEPPCKNHARHDADCGFLAAVEGMPCGHEHDGACGYQEAAEAVPCAEESGHEHGASCGYDGKDEATCTFEHPHDESCGYRESITALPCTHLHDEACGYVEAKEGKPCAHSCERCNPAPAPAPAPAPTEKTITAFEPLAGEIRFQMDLPAGAKKADLTLPDTLHAAVDGEPEAIAGVTWNCADYNDETGMTEPEYEWTPVMPEGYALGLGTGEPGGGITPPSIFALIDGGGVMAPTAGAYTANAASWSELKTEFANAIDAIDNQGYTGAVITITAPITLSEDYALDGGARSITLARGCMGGLIAVPSGNALALGNITLDGATETYPDAGGPLVKSAGTFTMNAGTVLQNNSSSAGAGVKGGGVHIGASAAFTMAGGTISGNMAAPDSTNKGLGGGVYVGGGATFSMTGGTISGNSAYAGGGVYIDQAAANAVSISGGITGNSATQDGGGIYVEGSAVTLAGAVVSDNGANYGGGAYVNLDTGQLNVKSATIERNSAISQGGGVLVQDDAKLFVTGDAGDGPGVIRGNTAHRGADVDLFDINGVGLMGVSGFVSIGSGNVGVYDANNGSGGITPNIYVAGELASESDIIIEGIAITPAPGVVIAKAYAGGGYTTLVNSDRNAFTYVNRAGDDYHIYISATAEGLVLGNFDLQREIYDAMPGGTVYVPDGLAIDNMVYVREADYTTGKSVTLTRANPAGAGDTIVRGTTLLAHLLQVIPGSTLTLKNISIDGGGNTVPGADGSLVNVESGALVMEDGTVLKNNQRQTGGGAVTVSNGSFAMKGGEIRGNVAMRGGGVALYSGVFTMSGGVIGGNIAQSDGGGVFAAASLMNPGSTVTMTGGAISGNAAAGAGGDLYVRGDTETLTLSGGVKIGGGGGLYNGGNTAGNVIVSGALTGGAGSVAIEGLADSAAGAFVAAGTNTYRLTDGDRGAFAYLPGGGLMPWLDQANNRIVLVEPAVNSVTVSPKTATVTKGGTQQFTAVVSAVGGASQTVTWSVDSAVSSIDGTGKLTVAANETKTTLTVTAVSTVDAGKKDTAAVEVKTPGADVAVTGVALDQSTARVAVGGTLWLTATVTPADATNKGVTWASSDASVAIVDANGRVTGVKAGTATITATTVDGGFAARCAVTVTAASGGATPTSPQTGDGNNIAPWIVAAIASLGGIGALVALVLRRKNKARGGRI